MSGFITEEQYKYVWQSVYRHIQELATGKIRGSIFLCHELARALKGGRSYEWPLARDVADEIMRPLLLADGLSTEGWWFPPGHLLHHESSLVKCKARLEWWERHKSNLIG